MTSRAAAANKPKLKAFSCTVKGTDWARVVHAFTRSKARYLYWLDVREPWPSITLMDIRVRTLGPPRNTDKFQHTAAYRNAWFKLGDEVRVGDSLGFVADSDSSANFVVHCFSGQYAGGIIHAHHSEIHPPEERREQA